MTRALGQDGAWLRKPKRGLPTLGSSPSLGIAHLEHIIPLMVLLAISGRILGEPGSDSPAVRNRICEKPIRAGGDTTAPMVVRRQKEKEDGPKNQATGSLMASICNLFTLV